MNRVNALIASLLLIATSLSGCLSEELIDDVLGCMDENAGNYDENATLEAFGDCFYMASMEQFMGAMDGQMSIDEMLNETPRAGYSTITSMSQFNEDMGGQIDILMEEHVMVDLATDSAMVRTVLSVSSMIAIDHQVIQVGQIVNIHSTSSGMMMEEAETISVQTRDAEGSIMDMVHIMLENSPSEDDLDMGGNDDGHDFVDFNGDGINDICPFDYGNMENPCNSQECDSGPDSIECQNFTTDYCENNDDDGCDINFMMVCFDENSWELVDDILTPGDCEDAGLDWLPVTVDDGQGDDFDMPEGTNTSFSFDSSDGSQSMSMSFTEGGMSTEMHIVLDESDELMSYEMNMDDGTNITSTSFTVMWGDAVVIEVDETLPRTSIPIWFLEDHDDDDSHDDDHDGHDQGDSDNDLDMFVCDNGDEVPMDYVNDGWDDCGDGSDEYDNDDSDDDQDDEGDDDGPPSPEEVMYMTDSDGDGFMSQDEFVTYWNNENSDAPLDSDQSFLTTEDVEDLIELCDYDDPVDLIDTNELECFIDNLEGMMPGGGNDLSMDDYFNHFDADGDGHITVDEYVEVNGIPEDQVDDISYMFDMYDNDASDGLDYYEFESLYYEMMADDDDNDDDHGDDAHDDSGPRSGTVADNMTFT
ncbi:MAG: hypothetical protein L7R66_05030, partial [Candidatus Thalassarchaeaceae archaeon]|nr:hypothetical protein [Candidatus Thalassarchaeaceae archaeon]